MIRLGFTGTQDGMTHLQEVAFRTWLRSLQISQFHFGDCIGADKEAYEAVRQHSWDVKTYSHPPTIRTKRAFCEADVILPEKPYLMRNHDIVDDTDRLIAAPASMTEELRSGTWATIRYAKKQGKPCIIIFPDGSTQTR